MEIVPLVLEPKACTSFVGSCRLGSSLQSSSVTSCIDGTLAVATDETGRFVGTNGMSLPGSRSLTAEECRQVGVFMDGWDENFGG